MRRAKRIIVVATLLVGRAAFAFPTGTQFDADPLQTAGGGSQNFTGSPNFAMGTCSTCHMNGALTLSVRLEADDASLFSVGYQPGSIYHLAVRLVGEHLGDGYNGPPRCGDTDTGYVPCNSNGFALEVDNIYGDADGALCATDPTGGCGTRPRGTPTILSMDGSAVHSTGYLEASDGLRAGTENGATAWDFYWTAPPAGSGPVSFNLGAVDGNGGAGTSDIPADATGDDTVAANITVPEVGAPALFASSGCTSGAGTTSGDTAATLSILAVAIFLIGSRRRIWTS